MNLLATKFLLTMILSINGQIVDKTIPVESETACQNLREEMKAAYTTYGMTEETVTIISSVCVDTQAGTVQ